MQPFTLVIICIKYHEYNRKTDTLEDRFTYVTVPFGLYEPHDKDHSWMFV